MELDDVRMNQRSECFYFCELKALLHCVELLLHLLDRDDLVRASVHCLFHCPVSPISKSTKCSEFVHYLLLIFILLSLLLINSKIMKFFFTLATFLAFLPYLLAQPCAIWGCGSSTLQNNCLTFLSSSPQNLITLSQCVTNKECPLSSLTSFLNNLRVYEADNSTANPGVVPC